VYPELARLLLRQRARPVAAAERPEHRCAVCAAEVVALPTPAVIEDRLAAIRVTNGTQLRCDPGDRGVPVDLLERAVGPAPQRARDAVVVAVLVVIEAQRLLARVALARGVGLVAADPLEPAGGGHSRIEVGIAGRAEAHLDPAIALAQ